MSDGGTASLPSRQRDDVGRCGLVAPFCFLSANLMSSFHAELSEVHMTVRTPTGFSMFAIWLGGAPARGGRGGGPLGWRRASPHIKSSTIHHSPVDCPLNCDVGVALAWTLGRIVKQSKTQPACQTSTEKYYISPERFLNISGGMAAGSSAVHSHSNYPAARTPIHFDTMSRGAQGKPRRPWSPATLSRPPPPPRPPAHPAPPPLPCRCQHDPQAESRRNQETVACVASSGDHHQHNQQESNQHPGGHTASRPRDTTDS